MNEATIIQNQTFDEERALYGTSRVQCANCRFEGPRDGESAFKESKDIIVCHSHFALRYPFWHCTNLSVTDSQLTDTFRAALWYTHNASLQNCDLGGIKAVRECGDIRLDGCRVVSDEFGWHCQNVTLLHTDVVSEYFLLATSNVLLDNVRLNGKYSFQYVTTGTVKNSVLDTKDAFWHAKDVVVEDCEIHGEYLGWYSENLTLRRCKIQGTQPFCYCKNLILEDCEMTDCDLAFEKSTVNAVVKGHIDSIKNPQAGSIVCHSVGEIIRDTPTDCSITLSK